MARGLLTMAVVLLASLAGIVGDGSRALASTGGENDPPATVRDSSESFEVVTQLTTTGDAGDRRRSGRARPLTIGEMARIPFDLVARASCDDRGPLGRCAVPVPCGNGATEEYSFLRVFANQANPESRCPLPAPAADIAAEVLRAFQQVALPPAELTIQPPDGTTLVNLDTNFYTAADPFTTTVTLLDQTITLHIHPTAFTWTFGDGTTSTTTTPGAPYPDLQVTHAYTQPGTVTTQLTTTWSADYQIGTGPTHTVDGTVTMTSDPVPLRIREATPVLVD